MRDGSFDFVAWYIQPSRKLWMNAVRHLEGKSCNQNQCSGKENGIIRNQSWPDLGFSQSREGPQKVFLLKRKTYECTRVISKGPVSVLRGLSRIPLLATWSVASAPQSVACAPLSQTCLNCLYSHCHCHCKDLCELSNSRIVRCSRMMIHRIGTQSQVLRMYTTQNSLVMISSG